MGHRNKKFAETAMNERSSRAHTGSLTHLLCTYFFKLKSTSKIHVVLVMQFSQIWKSKDLTVKSQLHLVDLAGSERIKKSKVEGTRLKEAVGINSSLLTLGKVITSLVESKRHVPYLESKLTTVLRAAFGGNSRTTVIVNCRTGTFQVHSHAYLNSGSCSFP